MLKTIALALLAALLLAAGCGKTASPGAPDNGTAPEAPPVKAEKTVIGVLLPLSGPDAAKGHAVLAGLKLAIQKKGTALGLDESSLEIKDVGRPDADVLGLARALVEVEGCAVLVGPIDSAGVNAVDELGRQKRVPVLTTVSGALQLSRLDCTVYRLTFSDEEEGAAMAELAAKKGLREAAVLVSVGSPAGEARAKGFADRFGRLGGHVLPQVGYSKDDADFRRTVRMAAYQKPDVYYLSGGRDDSAAIVGVMKEQNVLGAILGTSEWGTLEFPVEVSPGAMVCAPARFFDPSASTFVLAFRAANQRDPGAFDAMGYDAGVVIIDALLRGGELAERVGSTKMLAGAKGDLNARPTSLAARVTVLRLMGKSFLYDSTVEIK